MKGYIEEIRKILSEEQVTVNETLLEQHSHDESYHTPHLPDMVIYPRDTAEVSAGVMRMSMKYQSFLLGKDQVWRGMSFQSKGVFPWIVLDESNIGTQGK